MNGQHYESEKEKERRIISWPFIFSLHFPSPDQPKEEIEGKVDQIGEGKEKKMMTADQQPMAKASIFGNVLTFFSPFN